MPAVSEDVKKQDLKEKKKKALSQAERNLPVPPTNYC